MFAMLADLLKALPQPPATETELQPAPERARAQLLWEREQCTGCGLCASDCPADALHMTVLDRKTKRLVLFYDAAQCVFCGQCVVSCNRGALTFDARNGPCPTTDREALAQAFGTPQDIAQTTEA